MACANTSLTVRSAPPAAAAAAAAAERAPIQNLFDAVEKAIKEKTAAAQAAPKEVAAKIQGEDRRVSLNLKRKVQQIASQAQIQVQKKEVREQNSKENVSWDVRVKMREYALVDAGRSICAENITYFPGVIAQCYRGNVLKMQGICHPSDVSKTKEFVAKIVSEGFTRVEFGIIGCYEDQELAGEVESALKQAGFHAPVTKILNPFKVIDAQEEEFSDFCARLGFALDVGITREGELYYASYSILEKFDIEVVRTLNDFFTSNEAKLRELAEACKKDPVLQSFWLEFVAHAAEEIHEGHHLEAGLEIFKGFL